MVDVAFVKGYWRGEIDELKDKVSCYEKQMDKALGVSHDERDEYEITFFDDGNSLAWVTANDLVLILKAEEKHMR